MNDEELARELYVYADAAMHMLRESYDLCIPIYRENAELEDIHQFVLTNLISSCHQSSESSLLLVGHRRLWDSEILKRSVLEGTTKLLYISIGNGNEILLKCDEFYRVIPEITQINLHKKATELLMKINDLSTLWPDLKNQLLSNEKLMELEIKYPRNFRKMINQKWSFSEMVKTLEESKNEGFEIIKGTYYKYSFGSHFVHQDGDSISYMWDRNKSDVEGRTSSELAHGKSTIKDILTLAMIRMEIYFGFHDLDTSVIDKWEQKVDEFYNIIK
ncbi:DUF5677 domain-containing protein [Paenibacillus sp. S150]|uniref:DUF5677 domain-containing protein n=1 Tax=Paenibacillus sp. S150 TaxID=2749826 RepID=UPI001C55AE47|nr:DUF5677 domain-containing protein [Paenibacillus sp. S150]MBW4081276.1 hypothetical protein [Paenibacillus sp. S150]